MNSRAPVVPAILGFVALGFVAVAEDPIRAVSAEAFLAHVRVLAADEMGGRRAGTPEADRAAAYVASRFREAGLEPAGEDGYFQVFEAPLPAVAGEASRFEWRGEGSPEWRKARLVVPVSVSTGGEAEGEAAFLRVGTDEVGSLRDLGVRGKVVIVLDSGSGSGEEDPHARLGPSVREVALAAKHAGAAALVRVAPAESTGIAAFEAGPESGIPVLRVSYPEAEALARDAGVDLGALANPAGGETTALPLEGIRVRLRADVRREKAPTRNVLGRLPGSGERGEVVVVCAHYDHIGRGGEGSLAPRERGEIHNGADDNASGTAALVEIARSLAARRESLRRDVLLAAFSGEELGLLGSAAFVEGGTVGLDRVVLALNLDMVGRYRDGSLQVGGVGTSPALREIVETRLAPLGLEARLVEGARGFGGSDHLTFYERGIPVLFFFTGVHEDYHRPSDDAEKVNAEGGARIATLAAGVAYSLASDEAPLPFARPKEPETRPSGGPMRAWLGTVPDYAETEGGVRLSGVSEGSPAEKAGLLRGDLLKRVGEYAIASIYDLTFALERLRPGAEVEILFERDGETKTLTVRLGRRG